MAKLLLVEDDNNLREIYEARLSAEGYDITTAQNGEEALSVAKSVHPDLIISDVMMPRISGFEMLDILRNTDELKNTKIIMLTALGQAEDRGRADNLGADRYLVKSQVTLEDIVKAAEELLSDTPVGAPAEAAPQQATAPESVPVAATPAPETQVVTPVAEEAPAAAFASTPVEPASQVIPEPVAVAPAEEIAAPAPAEPVTAPEPVQNEPAVVPPVAETVVAPQVPTTVTVTDPDPIAAVPTVPETVPAETAPTAPAAAASTTVPDESQSLAAEEEAIQQQIASFAATPEPTPVPAPVTPTPVSDANDAVLAQAMSDLTSATTDDSTSSAGVTPEAVPAPTPAPEPTPTPVPTPQPDTSSPAVDSQQVNGRKVIQPLDETASVGTAPDLQALLAAEDAKEAASVAPAPAPQPTAQVVEQPKPAIDPNTIAL